MMHATVDQARATSVSTSLSHSHITLCKQETMVPTTASGSRQYPSALRDWNRDLNN